MANSVLSLLIQSLYKGGGTKEAKQDLQQLEKGLGGAIQQATGFNLSMGSLSSLAGVAGVAIAGMHAEAKLFKDWSAYALEIGDLSARLGTSTEEASALKEMAGDLNVPLGSLEMAFKRMAVNGIAPSIEGLTQIRGKLAGAKDPTERLALAQKLLGRAGGELLPIFDQLTDEQLRGYVDGMREAQVISQDQVDMARRQRDALDALGDTWTAVKLSAGGFIAMQLDVPLQRINAVLGGQKTYWQALLETLGLAKPKMAEVTETAQLLGDEIRFLKGEPVVLQIDAETTEAEAALAEIASKIPGTPEYWAALELRIDAKAEDAITASRMAFLEWLRYHPTQVLTYIERHQMATGTGDQAFCFVAGTPVRMATGDDRPIEHVAIGDIVEAYEPELGLPCETVVTDTLRRLADHVNVLEFSNGAEIRVTDEHPILTPTGWMCARELMPGVSVLEADGRLAILETKRRVMAQVEVFNLTVAEPHTFVVAGLVVHNKVKQARGGPLADIALLGEEGAELVINGIVIPASDTRKLLSLGLTPQRKFGIGGAIDVETYGSWTTKRPLRETTTKSGESIMEWVASAPRSSNPDVTKSMKSLESDTGSAGASASAVASAAAVAAVVQQAALSAAAGVSATLPGIVTQQLVAQNQIVAAGQQSIVSAIEELRDVLVRAVRDGVQMGQGWSG